MEIELGCFTRPWGRFSLEEALSGVAGAGFERVGLTALGEGPVFSADSTEEEVAGLKARVEGHGLAAQVAFGNPDLLLGVEEAASRFRGEIERAGWLGMQYMVLLGTEEERFHGKWLTAVEQCLDFAREQGVVLLLKPHGGMSALGEDLLRAAARLPHPNFGICYDPGNIHYYTGQRAEEDLPKVAEQVRAMCIKDERGGKHGEVEITPGTGVVDFARIFSILDGAGFAGPCWVECVGGESLEEINAEAKKAFRFVIELAART
ncbi:MAG: sugar phosphate isomerase/epimerase [Armatimonadota bacterium]|nr:MAG: sugar phosphate isomerase/epimerase [Armatimonadota bacterium]